jgi:putative membrane protein
MITVALICAGLAASLHVYIFVMESVTWTTPRTRSVFGTTADEAQTTKMLAFNQGFYNLFLAVITGAGIAAIALGHMAVGAALVFAGVGSMLAAAFVLIASSRDMTRSAVIQGVFPLITVALLALGTAA